MSPRLVIVLGLIGTLLVEINSIPNIIQCFEIHDYSHRPILSVSFIVGPADTNNQDHEKSKDGWIPSLRAASQQVKQLLPRYSTLLFIHRQYKQIA